MKIVEAPLVGALSLESRMGRTDRAGTRPAPTISLADVVHHIYSVCLLLHLN